MTDIKIDKKIFEMYLREYKDFIKYLHPKFINDAFLKFCNFYDRKCGINPEIYFGLFLQTEVNKELCEKIRLENIDLEIAFIEKYIPILDYILNKMKKRIKIEDSIDKEGLIMSSIETYNGSKIFSIHMLDVLKGKYHRLPIQQEKNKNLNEIVVEYIKNNNVISIDLDYLDNLFVKLNIINDIEDQQLKDFCYLKYGHYSIYFSNYDIKKILKLTDEELIELNKTCLNLLKQIMNSKIDSTIKKMIK